MLHEFIALNRDEILSRCRTKVASRTMPPPTPAEIEHGVPVFLDQLSDALRLHVTSDPEMARSAVQHGLELLRRGFTVSQVVHDYGDVCQSITELAVEAHEAISADDFRMLNQCLDDAIAGAVSEFGRAQNQSTLEGETARGNERAGFVAHEMRNVINTALVAFEVLKTGNVGVGGSTGTVLHRSLLAARTLTRRSLAEVRLTQGVQNPAPFPVAGFIKEIAQAAALEANACGVELRVMPLDLEVVIQGDRQILAAVVMNLLQNAFKFTRPHTRVTLEVTASPERVLIEIRDECGGLPGGKVDDLFIPFEQRSADRSGLGLGLAFSRWAVTANSGKLSARDLPDEGCVFTVDMPRIAQAVGATV